VVKHINDPARSGLRIWKLHTLTHRISLSHTHSLTHTITHVVFSCVLLELSIDIMMFILNPLTLNLPLTKHQRLYLFKNTPYYDLEAVFFMGTNNVKDFGYYHL